MNKKPARNVLQGPLMYLLILAIILLMVHMLSDGAQPTTENIDYSTLLEWVENDLRLSQGEKLPATAKYRTLGRVVIQSNTLRAVSEENLASAELTGNYDAECVLPSEEQFYDDVNAIYTAVLGRAVSPTEYHFEITSKLPAQPAWWVEWVPLLVTVVLFGLLWYFMMRQQTGGGKGMMSFGRSRARMTDPNTNKVTFEDVAGADEEKEELAEIVQFLKNPQRFTKVGARIPTGVLLVGPPGTGKTLLARAVAGEAGVPFFTISGSDFVEMFVGVGASRVRDLFDQAKKNAPAIVFIDEIDAVGRQRGAGLGGGHDEREQTLNQLLVEMDGFTHNEGVIVMAATNRSDILDPALLRPGRFDRRIVVNYPDVKGREEILKVHSKGKPLGEDVDLGVLARRTPYFTGADLMNVMNEAALLTARQGRDTIHMDTIEEAITRVMAGPEKKSRKVTEMDRKLVAYHEGGHAIVAHYIPECDDVHEITTIPRGSAGGYTMYLPQEEFHYVTTARMKAQMASAMGGRVAEALIFGDITTGASSDIKSATEIARSMVTEYGMSSKLGPVFLGTEHEVFLGRSFSQQNSGFSEMVNTDIDSEVHALLQEAYDRAEQILSAHIDQLHGLAKILIDKEKIDRSEFIAFMDGKSAAETVETEFVPKPDPENAPWKEALGDDDTPAPTVNLKKNTGGEAEEQE